MEVSAVGFNPQSQWMANNSPAIPVRGAGLQGDTVARQQYAPTGLIDAQAFFQQRFDGDASASAEEFMP